MAPSLKLTYFDVPGTAEPIRWALEVGCLEWEDQRLSREEFTMLKPTLPNGQVPVLTVDGYMLPQSLAILRYVGRLTGLYPTDDLEAAKCDAIIHCGVDLSEKINPSIFEKDEEKKVGRDIFPDMNQACYRIQTDMSKHLEEAGGTYFCGGKLSIADFATVAALRFLTKLDHVDPEILTPFPNLAALMKTVTEEPKIAAFVAKYATGPQLL